MQKRKTPKYAFHQIPGGGGNPEKYVAIAQQKTKVFIYEKKRNDSSRK